MPGDLITEAASGAGNTLFGSYIFYVIPKHCIQNIADVILSLVIITLNTDNFQAIVHRDFRQRNGIAVANENCVLSIHTQVLRIYITSAA